MSDVITAAEMTKERLFGIFKNAYLKPDYDDEGDIQVKAHSGFSLTIILDSSTQRILFLHIFSFKEGLPRTEKLEFVNKLNIEVAPSRFSLRGDDRLVSEYYLPTGEGLLPLQILECLSIHDQATVTGIRALNSSGLVL